MEQKQSYCEADLRLCFRIAICLFSHDAAHIESLGISSANRSWKCQIF